MNNEKVKHRSKPAEPFAQHGAHGVITRCYEDGPLRITPAWRGIPAQAYVEWQGAEPIGNYFTWEKLSDLIEVGKR